MTFQEKEISDRLRVIGAYYDLDALLQDKTDSQAVAQYYRKSDFYYNLIHSRGGNNIHMGLSENGFYQKEDFEKQAQFVGEFQRMRKLMPEDASMNSIAGWLMLYTFDGETIHQYCRVVATKVSL